MAAAVTFHATRSERFWRLSREGRDPGRHECGRPTPELDAQKATPEAAAGESGGGSTTGELDEEGEGGEHLAGEPPRRPTARTL